MSKNKKIITISQNPKRQASSLTVTDDKVKQEIFMDNNLEPACFNAFAWKKWMKRLIN